MIANKTEWHGFRSCASRHIQSAASSLPPLIFVFNPEAGLNLTTRLGVIIASVPVFGLRPERSGLDLTVNTPKLLSLTEPSLTKASQISPMTWSTNSAASFLGSDTAA